MSRGSTGRRRRRESRSPSGARSARGSRSISPRCARSPGRVISVRAMSMPVISMHAASVTTTSTRVRPAAAVGHARHGHQLLRGGQPDARGHRRARRTRGPKSKRTTSRCGLRSLKTAIAATWSAGGHRAVDADRHRHGVAVLHQRRRRRAAPCLSRTGAPPVKPRSAAARSLGVARAGAHDQRPGRPPQPGGQHAGARAIAASACS